MGWNDDSWRDSYDAWKLQGPDDDYDENDDYDEDGCMCDDYEVDTLEGRARCYRCGRSWTLTAAQLDRAFEVEAAAQAQWELENDPAHQRRQARREWWRNLRGAIAGLVWYRWRRKPAPGPVLDDDIPF